MTDKTPQNKAENPVNTPKALARTTGTARNSEPKSRALPQADALKVRFKAGSIPLQTDFADLIDLANIGRQAVGGAEGQTGPANGFTLSSMGCLELKPNKAKSVGVDQDGIKVLLGWGLNYGGEGIDVICKKGGGISASKDGIKVLLGWGLKYGGEGIDVICKNGGGLGASKDGIWAISGNGISVTSSGVNVKLAKGFYTNEGGGQGADGATSGSAGGLNLTQNGLSVDAGDGIQINPRGVSIKLAANSGLSADETNGLKVVPEQQFQKGMIMMFSGTRVPSGWALCDGQNGTPDLRDRFIVGKGSKFLGKGERTTSTGGATVTGSVIVRDTALTLSQIPK